MRFMPLLILMALACQGASGPDPSEVRATIERKNAAAERWYAEGRVDSVALMFSEDVWQMPPNSPPLVGRAAFSAFWEQAVQWGTWQFDLNTQDVVVADSIAVERGKYALVFAAGPTSPIPSSNDSGNYVVLWRLEPDGEWRALWDAPVSELSLPRTTH